MRPVPDMNAKVFSVNFVQLGDLFIFHFLLVWSLSAGSPVTTWGLLLCRLHETSARAWIFQPILTPEDIYFIQMDFMFRSFEAHFSKPLIRFSNTFINLLFQLDEGHLLMSWCTFVRIDPEASGSAPFVEFSITNMCLVEQLRRSSGHRA